MHKNNTSVLSGPSAFGNSAEKKGKLLIVGTGGQGKVVLDCAYALDGYSHISFLTSDLSAKPIAGFPLFYEQEAVPSFRQANGRDLSFLKGFDEVIVAIGNNETRLLLSRQLAGDGIKLATLIHPSASVSKFSDIQAGTVIFANAVINPFAKIGMACIINTGAVVEHDCILGDGVHISPNAAVAGSVVIGEQSWVCVGSSIANNIKIGANSIVGAGGAVLCDVPDSVLAAGIPAVVKKRFDS